MAPVNQFYPPPWTYSYAGMQPGQPGAPPLNGMSPRNGPIPLQQQPGPGTPTLSPANIPHSSPAHTPSASISSPPPTPNARLNTAAPTFVPGGARPPAKVTIKQADGHEVDLNAYKMNRSPAPASPAKPPVQLGSPNRRSQVRLESVEDRTKRLLEEGKIKAEQERLEREKKEKLKAEQEAQEQKEKEEKEKQEKEEREKREKEEKLKEEEENRKRREAEEAAKAEADRVAKEKAVEEERLRQKLADEEKERKAEADREAAAAAAATKAEADAKANESLTPFPRSASPVEEEKEEGEITAEEEKPKTNAPPPSELPRRRPGPLDLSSTQKPMSQPLPSALATARIIDDLGTVSYPEGIKSPSVELNVNAKDGKFR